MQRDLAITVKKCLKRIGILSSSTQAVVAFVYAAAIFPEREIVIKTIKALTELEELNSLKAKKRQSEESEDEPVSQEKGKCRKRKYKADTSGDDIENEAKTPAGVINPLGMTARSCKHTTLSVNLQRLRKTHRIAPA